VRDRSLIAVWTFRTDLPERELACLAELLDDRERARAGALVFPDSRRRFTGSHGGVRVILGRYLDLDPRALRWEYGPHGKPSLVPPLADVSISHSGDVTMLAACARRPVGIDVERLPDGRHALRIARRFYPAREAQFVADGAGPDGQADRFTRLWVRKEACVKVPGGRLLPGLAEDMRRPPHWVRDVVAPPGFRAAVAAKGRPTAEILQLDTAILR